MTSSLAWLDFSRDEQRRVRELLNLFDQTDSRDELGLGVVRDAFSEALFPGTSTIHTRARYLLLVPWCYQDAESRGGGPSAVRQRLERNERKLISAFLEAEHVEGLIGRRAGAKNVQTLPSTIYASALIRYGIRLTENQDTARIKDHLDNEMTDRAISAWSPTLPTRPEVEDMADRGFDLSYDEAEWLRARLIERTDGSLLAHLVRQNRLSDGTPGPWGEPSTKTAASPIKATLKQAELFSLGMHGAALLYNLLLATAYTAKGYTEQAGREEEYLKALHVWAATVMKHPERHRLGGADLWTTAVATSASISSRTQAFITDWLALCRTADLSVIADNRNARQLVHHREVAQKNGQARLTNDALLKTWSGASGRAQLSYRWTQVSRLLRDIHDGLRPAHAGS